MAAEMLLERKLYITIGNETGASSATIAKIAKLLKQRNSGLKNVFYRLYGRQKYADLENDRLRHPRSILFLKSWLCYTLGI
jgi:hypothetical protein